MPSFDKLWITLQNKKISKRLI